MRLLLLLLTATIPVFATPKLESVSSIPSSAPDSLNDTAGSFGSGAAYDPYSKTLYLTTDRGPGDGEGVGGGGGDGADGFEVRGGEDGNSCCEEEKK